MRTWVFAVVSLLFSLPLGRSSPEQCGRQANSALCSGGLCCSESGWCGNTDRYCGDGCQSQCGGGGDLDSVIPRETFEEFLENRNNYLCPARGFYTYDAFISAAKSFPEFGNTGNLTTRKKEVAAFFGQTSEETTGRAPEGPYTWGYCYVNSTATDTFCQYSPNYPCAPGKKYYGRGPMQLQWNYNYGQCGSALGLDLLNNPDLIATDPVISFKAAIWFWITTQAPKPSCHDVITGIWTPSDDDIKANRLPGYGVLTNIINGGFECGQGWNLNGNNRIGYYKRYCDIYEVDYGDHLDCYDQEPFANELLDLVDTM